MYEFECKVYGVLFQSCSFTSINQVLQGDNGDALGDEIIFLTDGQATDNIDACVPSAIQSGAIISTLAFSKDAVKALLVMAEQTG